MRLAPLRTLAALFVAGAMAACADQPTAPAAPETAGPLLSSSALSVWMYCEYGYCEATASGGTGNYTWSWANANPHNTTGPISTATPCWTYNGQTVTVTATVNDGVSTASASRRYKCSYSPN